VRGVRDADRGDDLSPRSSTQERGFQLTRAKAVATGEEEEVMEEVEEGAADALLATSSASTNCFRSAPASRAITCILSRTGSALG
jgi:hypothetical protein